MNIHAYNREPRRGTISVSAILILLAFTSLLAVGCGGGSGASNATEASATGASAAFLKSGSANNKLVEFGSEAPTKARSEASAVLTKNLEAREGADFATQCATLATSQLEQVSNAKGSEAIKNCPTELRKLAEPLSESRSIRANELTGPIAALRLKGNQAYALFHGADRDDYAVPMRKENGEWKVASILLTKLGTS